jgi:hypothetical protein
MSLCGFSIWLFVVLVLVLLTLGRFCFLLFLLFILLLAPTVLKFGAANRRLVIHECMQRNDGPQKAAKVHDEERVVRGARKASREDGVSEVGEEIKRVLEEIDDLVVYGRAAIVIARNIDEVALHVREARREPTQRSELLRHARRERRRSRVLDITQQMLDADLLRLFRLDRRRRVQERLARFRPILRERDIYKKGQRKEREGAGYKTHVFDLFDGKIRVGGYADCVWTHVDDDHHRPRDEALEKLVDLQIRRAEFRARMVPPDHAFPRCKKKPITTCRRYIKKDAPLTFLNISNIDST